MQKLGLDPSVFILLSLFFFIDLACAVCVAPFLSELLVRGTKFFRFTLVTLAKLVLAAALIRLGDSFGILDHSSMNNQKIDIQGQIQPSNGVIGNGVVELVSQDSQFVNVRPWNLGICLGIGAGGNSQPQNSVPVNLSSPIINCLDAPVPGLYTAERCVDLPYDHQTSSPTFSPKSYDSEYQLNPCSADVFSVSVSEQDGSDFPSGSLLQSAAKAFLYGDQNQFYASEKSYSRLQADLTCSGGKQDFRVSFSKHFQYFVFIGSCSIIFDFLFLCT